LSSYACNRSGSPPGDYRSRLGGPCNFPLILLTLCQCSPEMLPCLVDYRKTTQLSPRPYHRFTSYLYKVYENIPPLVTSWYTIWAKVILILATYRRVVTDRASMPPKLCAKYASIWDLDTLLRTNQFHKLKAASEEKGFHGSSFMDSLSCV